MTVTAERTAVVMRVLPDPVPLTEDEITAALFAFSGLADEYPAAPTAFMVADELAGIVPFVGLSAIRAAADRIPYLEGERMARCRALARHVSAPVSALVSGGVS